MSFAAMFPADPDAMDLKAARTLLGVNDKSTKADVHSSWRAKLLIAHPDKGGSSAQLAKLQKAYEIAHARAPDADKVVASTTYRSGSDPPSSHSGCSSPRSTAARGSLLCRTTSRFDSHDCSPVRSRRSQPFPPDVTEAPLGWEDQFEGFALTCAFTEPDWGFEVNYEVLPWRVAKIIPSICGRTTQAITKGLAIGLCVTHVCEVSVTDANASQLRTVMEGGGYVKVRFAPPVDLAACGAISTAMVPFNPRSHPLALVPCRGADTSRALVDWCRSRKWWWKKDAVLSEPARAFDQIETWFKGKKDFAVTWMPKEKAEPRGRRFRFRTEGRFTSSYEGKTVEMYGATRNSVASFLRLPDFSSGNPHYNASVYAEFIEIATRRMILITEITKKPRAATHSRQCAFQTTGDLAIGEESGFAANSYYQEHRFAFPAQSSGVDGTLVFEKLEGDKPIEGKSSKFIPRS